MIKTVDFKRFSVDFIFEWVQLFGKYNWYRMTLFNIYLEKDVMHGCFEVELYLLGCGIRVYWVYNSKTYNQAVTRYFPYLGEDDDEEKN